MEHQTTTGSAEDGTAGEDLSADGRRLSIDRHSSRINSAETPIIILATNSRLESISNIWCGREDGPLACLAWSSTPRHIGSRDRYVGWSGKARRRNIRYLAMWPTVH